ncbi:hypothetical protein G6011_10085 [Alternaria panax]|uniref:Uncharacterized protein n=1 Tax=Alternaria panax TaxID=48097 RepID=A0AAD4FC01_9PLEO|nr:hypothetical protein G6011_10085 [Alternaria panax]
MTAPPAARPLFSAAHSMPFVYPSPASTITSDTGCLHYNFMSPPQDLNDPLCSRKSASPSPTAQPAGGGGFRWITGNKPDDFKTKPVMQAVRRTAMGSYLKGIKNQAGGKSRANSEVSNKSRSSVGSQGGAQPRPIKMPKGKGKSDSKKKDLVPEGRQLTRNNNPSTSNSDTQVARQSTLPQRPIVVPIVVGRIYPFDIYQVPELFSLGKGLDPFGTMYQSRDSRVNVERLKFKCAGYFGTAGLGRHWIPVCLNYPHTFLSTLYMASAYDDVIQNRKVESLETVALRQDVIHFVSEHLTDREQRVADYNIMAVSQLILGDVISRAEAGLDFHQSGIAAMIRQRGGLDKLGVNRELASAVSWANLATAVLREGKPDLMYVEYCLSRLGLRHRPDDVIPESPLYQPHGRYVTLEKSIKCSSSAQKLLEDIRTMMEAFLDAQGSSRQSNPSKIEKYHSRINQYASDSSGNHSRYEAIRLTARVQAQAMIDRVPLSEALNRVESSELRRAMYTSSIASQSNDSIPSTLDIQHITPATDCSESSTFGSYSDVNSQQQSGFPFGHRASSSSTRSQRPSIWSLQSSSSYTSPRRWSTAPTSNRRSILQQLRDALEESNLSQCWGDMAGVLLWIGLVMGAASNKSEDKMLRRYLSATTMRACVMLCFEHPEAIHCTMLKMTSVVEALSDKPDDGQLVRKDSATSGKRRKA